MARKFNYNDTTKGWQTKPCGATGLFAYVRLSGLPAEDGSEVWLLSVMSNVNHTNRWRNTKTRHGAMSVAGKWLKAERNRLKQEAAEQEALWKRLSAVDPTGRFG